MILVALNNNSFRNTCTHYWNAGLKSAEPTLTRSLEKYINSFQDDALSFGSIGTLCMALYHSVLWPTTPIWTVESWMKYSESHHTQDRLFTPSHNPSYQFQIGLQSRTENNLFSTKHTVMQSIAPELVLINLRIIEGKKKKCVIPIQVERDESNNSNEK